MHKLQHYISQLACRDAIMHVCVHMSTAHGVTLVTSCAMLMLTSLFLFGQLSSFFFGTMADGFEALESRSFAIDPPWGDGMRVELPSDLTAPLPAVGAMRRMLESLAPAQVCVRQVIVYVCVVPCGAGVDVGVSVGVVCRVVSCRVVSYVSVCVCVCVWQCLFVYTCCWRPIVDRPYMCCISRWCP
jgi:hypothetical protein